MKFAKIVITLLFFISTTVSVFAQCAMCKAVVESDASMAKGVNDGILYLMAIPYLLLIFIGYLVYNHYNKTKTNA